MAQIRLYVTNDVPEEMLAQFNELEGVTAGGRVVEGDGGIVQDEECVVIFYLIEGSIDRGAVRIPLVHVAGIDEGIRKYRMGGMKE